MKLEKFEQEYLQEIETLQKANFSNAHKDFKFPGYNFFYTKALSIAFAVPAVVAIFAVFLTNTGNQTMNNDLAMLEESNNRILEQINSLDHENDF